MPVIGLSGTPGAISGIWGLYELTAVSATGSVAAAQLALFRHDDGRLLDPTARWLWDHLLRPGTTISPLDALRGAAATDAALELGAAAEQRGGAIYPAMIARLEARTAAERDRGAAAYAARRGALERIGLTNVRRIRLAELAEEERVWRAEIAERARVHPQLTPLLIVRVEAR